MDLRIEPIKHLVNNEVKQQKDLFFVFINDVEHELPIGLLYNADTRNHINIKEKQGWHLRLYTTPRQAYGLYGTFDLEVSGVDGVRELFSGERADIEDRLRGRFRELAHKSWEQIAPGDDCAYDIRPSENGFAYFGFMRDLPDPSYLHPRDWPLRNLHVIGRIQHTGHRLYSVTIMDGEYARLREGLSLKQARAYAKTLEDRETYVEEMAYAFLHMACDYLYVYSCPKDEEDTYEKAGQLHRERMRSFLW